MSGRDQGGLAVSDRRGFLKGAGAVAVGGVIAGCTGGDGGGGDGNGDGGAATTTADPAADYPERSIDFIVPYATGGGFDAYARLMKPYLEEQLGVTVNVRNVTGGGGVVGATQAYNAEPDGHTLLIWSPKEGAYKQIGLGTEFDIREFSHIGHITQDPNAMALMRSAGITTWDGFVDAVGDLNFVTQGQGSSAHMLTIILGGMTGEFSVDVPNFVHYGGTGEALGGLERGEGQAFMVGTASSAVKVVQALDADMFMVFASPDHPIADYMANNDVEVVNYSTEVGVDNMEAYNELTVFRRFLTGPPGVPDAIQEKQVAAFDAVVNDEQFLQETTEAARPVIEPAAGPEAVSESIETTFANLDTEPYRGLIQDAFSG